MNSLNDDLGLHTVPGACALSSFVLSKSFLHRIFNGRTQKKKIHAELNGTKFGFPDCVVNADGADIVFYNKPELDGETRFSYKSYYAMKAILVTDHSRLIRYAHIGDTLWFTTAPLGKCKICGFCLRRISRRISKSSQILS